MGLREEAKEHLTNKLIPFWMSMRDNEQGGFYGYADFDYQIHKEAKKGCILNSRITWFFSSAYTLLRDPLLLQEAAHGYRFLKEKCLDREYGGVFWSVSYDGTPADTMKHTYNQAFSIYALCAYYEASGDAESIQLAEEIFQVMEERCMDESGYLESFDREFGLIKNEKLSENGVTAERTMNTLLHVFEAYTELYRLTRKEQVKKRLEWILDTIAEKVYNPQKHRQEVFFNLMYDSIIDLHSYGHDIEAAWLIDRGVEVLGEVKYYEKMMPITRDLVNQVYDVAFDGQAVFNECDKGIVDTNRVWWVQAESVVGFLNAYYKESERKEYYEAAVNVWNYIKEYVIDSRREGEWFWLLNQDGIPYRNKPMADEWKCPYHNGRMCIEVIRRETNAS